MPEPTPFIPTPRDPLQAHLENLLLTRQQPWTVALGNRTVAVSPQPSSVPFSSAGQVIVRCGDQDWPVELGSMAITRWHPALADVALDAPLPKQLELAILDLILAPVLPTLQHFMGCGLEIREIFPQGGLMAPGPATITLSMRCAAPHEGEAPIPVRIHAPDRRSALFLAERLATLPIRVDQPIHEDLTVEVCIDAGSMRLSLQELANLAQGDVLLPPQYQAANAMLILRPRPRRGARTNDTKPGQAILCTVQDNQATVLTIVTPSEEPSMTTSASSPTAANTPVPPAGSEVSSLDVGGIEVELCFELERRLMTIKDMAALTPGYTFTLGCDPLAPVSLRVNGAIVGTGRLVDINGILGVQINALTQSGEQDVRR